MRIWRKRNYEVLLRRRQDRLWLGRMPDDSFGARFGIGGACGGSFAMRWLFRILVFTFAVFVFFTVALPVLMELLCHA